jgi:hypothetical protein
MRSSFAFFGVALLLSDNVFCLVFRDRPQRHIDLLRTNDDPLHTRADEGAVDDCASRALRGIGRRPCLLLKRAANQPLDLWAGDARDRAGVRLVALQDRLRDVIAVAHALLVGVARAHRMAPVVEDEPRENRR